MFNVPSDAFLLSGDPVVLCRGGEITFANGSAMDILGRDCVGKKSEAVFGRELEGVQSSHFVANMPVDGVYYILRVSRSSDVRIVFFSRQSELPLVINDAVLFSMRNSLMNISMSTGMLRDKAEAVGDTAALDYISALTRNYYSMFRLLRNASAVHGVINNDLAFMPSVIDLSEQCRTLIETMQWLCRSCEFSKNLGDGIKLCADGSLINLLVENLVSNCLVHAKGLTRIAVSLLESQDSVILSVSDDGCGIPENELYSVFDRYRHGFDVNSLKNVAGLGLTVARGIAAIHGGTLLLESREGHGTTVRASFRKDAFSPLRAGATQQAYGNSLKSVLIGLADCLPTELYTENYMD